MIRHILFWKFNEQTRAGQNTGELIRRMDRSARNMVGKIDGLLRAEVGENTAGGPWDFIFYSELTDQAALDAYQNPPPHAADDDCAENASAKRTAAGRSYATCGY